MVEFCNDVKQTVVVKRTNGENKNDRSSCDALTVVDT